METHFRMGDSIPIGRTISRPTHEIGCFEGMVHNGQSLFGQAFFPPLLRFKSYMPNSARTFVLVFEQGDRCDKDAFRRKVPANISKEFGKQFTRQMFENFPCCYNIERSDLRSIVKYAERLEYVACI